MSSSPRTARVRAPELRGRGWLNTGGAAYSISELRGRFVLLDFWTFCCVNCLHVIEELRPVEEKYAEELVVVGVHSPKFVHEADPEALAAAVERYAVHHPVLDDPELITWQAYTARAWPTLVLVDPEGYVVAQYAGEGHAHAIDRLLEGWSRSTGPRARCSRATRRTSRRRSSRPRCGSRRTPRRWRAATCWSPTPVTTGSWSSTPRVTWSASGAGSRSRTGSASWAARRTSPTRPTTSSRASTWSPAR